MSHWLLVPLLVAMLSLLGCDANDRANGDSAPARQIRIAAAADLKFAMDEIILAFNQRHPDIAVAVTYGSSGNLFAQLTSRAPFDIYFSADVQYPRKLIEQGTAEPDSAFLYAIGRIVIWVPGDSPLDLEALGMPALLEPSVRRIAIANPRHAPYGVAAEAAMRHAGIYEEAASRLVLGENVAQAAQFVESGAADTGIIALALALSPPMREKGRFWEVPQEAYPPLEQGGLILPWAQDREAAERFRDFVLAEQGREILARYGFLLPGE